MKVENHVTADRTQKLQQALAPLLAQRVQQFLLFYGNSQIRPYAEISDDTIIVHNLPSWLTRDELTSSFIDNICHQVKNLYSDGDRLGKKAALQKVRNKEHLENNCIRMCLTYVYTSREVSDDRYQDIIISFIPSYTKYNPPKFIERFKRSDINEEQLKQFRCENRLIDANNNRVTTWRKMNADELNLHTTAFIGACYEGIQQHINQLFDIISNVGSEKCCAEA